MLKPFILICLFLTSYSVSFTTHAGSGIDAGKSHALFSEAMADLLGRHGKKKSSEKAFKKFEQLAQKGWKTAQHMLGNMYYKGEGTTKNNVKAYLWYSLAANQDYGIAEEKISILKRQLKQSEIDEAEIMLTNWKSLN